MTNAAESIFPAPVTSLRAPAPRLHQWKRRGIRLLVEGFFHGSSGAARLHPLAKLHRHGVEVLRDIPYVADGHREHLLDIYRPVDRSGPLPVIFYVHGGGFSLLSKETHWIFGLMFARKGYLVVNINYRLAPQYGFPAGAMDVCRAYHWMHNHIAEYGGDPTRVAVAGESAGANFATVLAIASCARRAEPWAREIFDLNQPPAAVLPACGLMQVSDVDRFKRQALVGAFVADRLTDLATSYLGELLYGEPSAIELADPLILLERTHQWERPLPPFFIAVGSADPVLHDSQRLEQALSKAGVRHVAKYYPREPHAFHAFVFRKSARECWHDTYAFLDQHVPIRKQ
jgi:acetyl esterase